MSASAQSSFENPDTHIQASAIGLASHVLAEVVPFPETPARLGDVLAALTYALDLASGERAGYTLRCTIIGMHLGKRLGLEQEHAANLFHALLLNGLGTPRERVSTCEWMGMSESLCRHALRGFDWTTVERARVKFLFRYAFQDAPLLHRVLSLTGLLPRRKLAPALRTRRSFTGARLARKLALPPGVSIAMQGMDERWDGSGTPRGAAYDGTSTLSHVCCVAQDLAAFGDLIGRAEAVALIEQRSGSWYDPGVVAAAITMHESGSLWHGLDADDLLSAVAACDPQAEPILCDDDKLETICAAVADVIDSRSSYTALHSHGVAQVAAGIGTEMHLNESEMRTLRCASLLHDIGKLTVPAEVLDHEGPLTETQMSSVRQSPVESYEVLRRIRSFESIALLAQSHHERLDGSGYPHGLQAQQIGKLSRILAMAEAYDALRSPRPYREDHSETEVMALLAADIPHALDAATFEALKRWIGKVPPTLRSEIPKRDSAYQRT
jgi:HD-GYP domain-containing protein (c-di-GMP phosphodiesterase class II)